MHVTARYEPVLLHRAGQIVEGGEDVDANGAIEIVQGDVLVGGAHVVRDRAVDIGRNAAPAPVAAIGPADADGGFGANATNRLRVALDDADHFVIRRADRRLA